VSDVSPNRLLTDLEQLPLPSMLGGLGRAIADAQLAMDQTSLEIARRLGDNETHGVRFSGEQENRSLLELGFAPTFYHPSEATVDVRVSLSMSQSTETSVSLGATVGGAYGFVMFAASVSASYTAKYSYEAAASSAITARFVAIPAPTLLAQTLASQRLVPAEIDVPGPT
jgi:hypothetical protein